MAFYKILNDTLCHHGFQYKLGLNIDTVLFNPSGTCEPGGLYFADLENIMKFISFGTKLAYLTIPDDAKVYKDPKGDKYKADRIYINKIIDIQDFEYWNNEEFCLQAVCQSSFSLQYVKDQTHEICMAAVQKNGLVLQCVQNKSPEICAEAIYQNSCAKEFIPLHMMKQAFTLRQELKARDAWGLFKYTSRPTQI